MVELPRQEIFETVPETEKTTDPSGLPPTAQPSPVVKRPIRTLARRVIISVLLLVGAAYSVKLGHDYWTIGRFLETTDNAYVKADYTTVAPKIAGYIRQVLVNDNDRVEVGQVLAQIDDRDFQAALSQAGADVAAAEAAISNLDAEMALQISLIDQAQASVEVSKASFNFAKSDAARMARLTSNGSGTLSRAEQSQSILDQASAAVVRDEAALLAAQNKVPVLRTQREQALARKNKAAAAFRQAELNLSYTLVKAAVSGTVGARSVRIGQYVASGTQLMALVPLHSVYIVANFKETQLTYIRAGQPVEIKVDSFPDVAVKGHVDSISPASGLEFSLLPPDNATGNFTKIVQRIPVKIVLDDDSILGLLRSGMSVETAIDTRSARSGPL